MTMLNIIVIIVGVLSLIILIILRFTKLIDWHLHHTMVENHTKLIKGKLIKGNFNDFHAEMKKQTWCRNGKYPESFFTPLDYEKVQEAVNNTSSNEESVKIIFEFNKTVMNYKQNYIHCEIICFNGVSMKLDYNSYKKYKQFLKYHRSEEDTYNWNLKDNE